MSDVFLYQLSVFRHASVYSTYLGQSVCPSHFRISVLSASRRPLKASRQYCGGWHGGWHGGGEGDRHVQNQMYKVWNVLKRSVLGPKLFDAKCTRLACLLRFVSLFSQTSLLIFPILNLEVPGDWNIKMSHTHRNIGLGEVSVLSFFIPIPNHHTVRFIHGTTRHQSRTLPSEWGDDNDV